MKKYILLSILLIVTCKSFSNGAQNRDKSTKSIAENLADASKMPNKQFLALDPSLLEDLSDDQFLERIQYDYTRNCLGRKDSLCTIENDGFRISLFCIAVKNNWLERERAATEVLQYLREFQRAKTMNGIMPRTFDRNTGEKSKVRYGEFGRPYDVVGTAFMAATLQFVVRQFFNFDTDSEKEIRQLCNEICNRIDWNFAYDDNQKCFTWFKNGDDGNLFDGKALLGEMDETFFMQLIVLGSKTWKHENEAYQEYLSKVFIDSQYGYRYYGTKEYNYKETGLLNHMKINNPEVLKSKDYPMAKLGYLVQPHIWFDFRNYNDDFCRKNNLNYFESVKNAISAQIQYAKNNPGNYPYYGDVWGFYDTCSPVTKKWMINGLPAEGDIDEGTISIDAAISAIVFDPESSIRCLQTLYKTFNNIYTSQGIATSVNTPSGKVSRFFCDSFFPPINVLLVENYRSGLIWDLSKSAPEYGIAFEKAGFKLQISDNPQWIGSKELNLDATSLCNFEISTNFKIEKGNNASLIFGANDFRLNDKFQNINNIAGENYVRVEIDLSGVGSPRGAVLNIYRVGYAKNDSPDVPFIIISKDKYPQSNINEIFTPKNKGDKHSLSIGVKTGNISFIIDGKELMIPINTSVDELLSLNSIGFAALPESKVVYTDYQIKHIAQSSSNVVFADKNYSVFRDIPNIEIDNRILTVSNDSDKMTISYSDPSHGSLTMLRTTFLTDVTKKISKAKIYATAMGTYEMFINGKRVGEDPVSPDNNKNEDLIGYDMFDVTKMLENGNNCIGAQLNPRNILNANPFGNYEALLVKLEITYNDGSEQFVVTDPNTWKYWNDGPVRSGNIINGERYDANKEAAVEGWTNVGYNDSSWQKTDIITPLNWSEFNIKTRYDERIHFRETLTAERIMPTHSADGHTYIYDMGVNMIGVPSVTIPAGWLQKGDTVIMRYAEKLYPGFRGDNPIDIDTYGVRGKKIAGRMMFENNRSVSATDFYIAKDSSETVIHPTTTYHSYRYVQITIPSYKGSLPVGNVQGLALSSDNLTTLR